MIGSHASLRLHDRPAGSNWDERLGAYSFAAWFCAGLIVALAGIAALGLSVFGVALPQPMLATAFFAAMALTAVALAASLFPVSPHRVLLWSDGDKRPRFVPSRTITAVRRVGSILILALVPPLVLAAIAVSQGWLD